MCLFYVPKNSQYLMIYYAKWLLAISLPYENFSWIIKNSLISLSGEAASIYFIQSWIFHYSTIIIYGERFAIDIHPRVVGLIDEKVRDFFIKFLTLLETIKVNKKNARKTWKATLSSFTILLRFLMDLIRQQQCECECFWHFLGIIFHYYFHAS